MTRMSDNPVIHAVNQGEGGRWIDCEMDWLYHDVQDKNISVIDY